MPTFGHIGIGVRLERGYYDDLMSRLSANGLYSSFSEFGKAALRHFLAEYNARFKDYQGSGSRILVGRYISDACPLGYGRETYSINVTKRFYGLLLSIARACRTTVQVLARYAIWIYSDVLDRENVLADVLAEEYQ